MIGKLETIKDLRARSLAVSVETRIEWQRFWIARDW